MSVTSVSEIVNNRPGYRTTTRRRVLAVVKRLGYRGNPIARQLRGSPSGVLGVLIGTNDAPVNFDRLAAIEHAAYARGYRLLIGQIHQDARRTAEYAGDFAARGVDGLIWLHQPFDERPEVPAVELDQLRHLVFLDQRLVKHGCVIRVDYADGIRQAMQHLRARGRQRIGLAVASRGLAGDPMAGRRRGYLDTDGSHPARIWVGDGNPIPTEAHLAGIVDELVIGQRADAVLASNDFWAVALIKMLRRRGLRVPQDVAVVGFDNLTIAEACDPELTTIDQHHEAFAAAAVDLLLKSMQQKKLSLQLRTATIPPRLIVRAST